MSDRGGGSAHAPTTSTWPICLSAGRSRSRPSTANADRGGPAENTPAIDRGVLCEHRPAACSCATSDSAPTCQHAGRLQIEEPDGQVVGDRSEGALIRIAVPVVVEQDQRHARRKLAAGRFVEGPFDPPAVKPRAQEPEGQTVGQRQRGEPARAARSNAFRSQARNRSHSPSRAKASAAQIDQGT